MKFNKPIEKDSLNIKAIIGSKNTSDLKGNDIIFTFSKDEPVSSVVFARELSKVLTKYKDRKINLYLSSFIDAFKPECPISFITLILSKIDAFIEPSWNAKSKAKNNEANVIFDKKDLQAIKMACTLTKSIHMARQYQIMPSNYLGIADYVKEIKLQFAQLNNKNLKVKVLTEADLRKEKMGLLLAVNKGSDEPAAMIVLEYLNSNKKDTLALVGKGIMNDTGGYEVKPYKFMDGMNQDMTGSATVLATMYSLAATNAKVNVIGLLPLAKNLINEKAMLVNDIYKACNGRSVEIMAPDAEGRLILADAIAYANKKYHVSTIATIATLTGLSELAFGDFLTPFWATKANTANLLAKASELSGEGLISLPIFPDFYDMVNESSKIADCSNNCSERNASNATAAAFLKLFSDCNDFVHFDIAGSNQFKKHPINPLGLTLFLFAKALFGDK